MTTAAFVAYPANPREIGESIRRVAERLHGSATKLQLIPWEQNDIAGRPLVAPIFEGIETSGLTIGDITTLNFNVTYELGYAIGSGKRVFLIKHAGIQSDEGAVRDVGIFDTLGYVTYSDSEDLHRRLTAPIDMKPIEITPTLNYRAPIYLLETPIRTEGMGHIVALVKKTRVHFRSFNPSEHGRLSAFDAITHVANSFAVLVTLQPRHIKDSHIHNIRAAFIAGLAHGMGKPTCILQNGDDPVPLDVRDFAVVWYHPNEVNEHIEQLAREVVDALQSKDELRLSRPGLLSSLSLGDPMAENEFQTLGNYYIETDQYQRTLRGEVNLVVGRKGTGKTALFAQVRDRLRSNKQKVVVDLKPEGYQLQKLKDDVFGYLSQGAKEHLVTAFWEYLLYLEVCHKVLEKDRDRHRWDHTLNEKYNRLSTTYYQESGDASGDFSERLHVLSDRISAQYFTAHGTGSKNVQLSSGEVTALLHRGDLRTLSTLLAGYLSHKDATWVLFDNLDRGWSPQGLTADDILIVRSLIDAGRKIQREMQRADLDFHCIIFLRNDVYQLLMSNSADFGKEIRTSLDWSDPDLLRELLRFRLVANDGIPADAPFSSVWAQICAPFIDGTESSQYLIDRSLMRPRNLLKEIIYCKGSAVNLRHDKILEEDIRKGLVSYSTDLLIEINQELAQIEPAADGFIYIFANEGAEFSREDLGVLIEFKNIPVTHEDRVIEYLLYFGFLGLRFGGGEPKYIHDVNYDMRMLKTHVEKYASGLKYVVNPAFWPALQITS